MKKLRVIQLLAILILFGAAFVSSGCGSKCGSGQEQGFPDRWAGKIPFVEGESLKCRDISKTIESNSSNLALVSGQYAHLEYDSMAVADVVAKYEQKYKSDGWTFDPTWNSNHATAEVLANKSGMRSEMTFSNTCSGRAGDPKCTSVSFKNVKIGDEAK